MKDKKRFFYGWLALAAFLPLSVNAQVTITNTTSKLAIGNSYLSRSINIASGHISPGELVNKKVTGTATFAPATGSEEFIFQPLNPNATTTSSLPTSGFVDRSTWTVTANSACTESSTSGDVNFIKDGNIGTMWHSNYSGASGGTGVIGSFPLYFQVDMKTSHTLKSFCYVPRSTGGDNGKAKGFKLYVSDNATTPGTAVMTGELTLDGTNPVWVNLPSAATGRYVRFEITSTLNGATLGSCSEFYVSEEAKDNAATQIKASDLTFLNAIEETITGGKRLTLNFAPYKAYGVDWTIKEIYEMKDNDGFMHKYLKLTVPAEQRAKASIDYIDMESLGTAAVVTANKWSRPTQG